ncbi:MAG: glycosyltransferase, partial [Synechococcus sp. BS307-5m-G37]|nr:glycosyltransferase [Synechococcus sp. BS307-5m-G37]
MSWLPLLTLIWPAWLSRTPEQLSPIWRRRSLIVLIGFFTLRYLLWRVSASLNLSTPLSTTLSLLLLAAEGWLLLSGMVPLVLAWRRFPDRRPAMHQLREQWRQSPWTPTVDILVPTYGEPINVLERTLIGCCDQTYPNTRVWVLDDSGRQEVKALASRQGCTYVHRSVRTSAKAGNLNHGLRRCRGELVAVFDADFIPQTTFLENSIGFLLDPKVGLLQTPQTFINADPVMRNLGMERWLLSDEESFYRWIEPVRDGWGAVVCAGTAFLARRSALDSVGGFVEKAISEDFVTGINLRRKGWSLLYLQQKLSAGLAAETMADFVLQRQRWASGTLQSLRLPEGPLRGGGLSPWQRVAYLEGVVHWINNLPRLVLMLMPLSYGLLGTVPILITPDDAVRLLLPLWATLLMGVGWLNRGSRTAFLSELTGWVLTVPLTVTVL